MQVSVSATGGLERRLEVAVPATEIAAEVEQRLKQISRTARLKGFRPGKAPFAVVKKQFGDQVHSEVVTDVMRSSFAQAITQEKLQPAAGPRIEPIAMQPGSDLKYAAVFEVLPEITVKPVDALTLERPTSSVTETDLDAMIESMRRQRPVFTQVERAAHATDRVILDFDGLIDGQPFEGGEGRDVAVVIGTKQAMPELEEGIKGATAGETRQVTLAFPAEHPNKNLAGKTAALQVTVKRVEEQGLPAVDEDFCKAYGVEEGGVEALRAEVRKSMERELEGVIRTRLRTQVMDGLYANNPLDLPRALIDEQVQQLQVDMARRIGARDINQLPPRAQFEEPARRRVALGLLMGQIVENQSLKVDRVRVQERLGDLIAAYPNPEEARKAYLQNPEAMKQVESSVLEEQVVDWVIERARVTDKPVSFRDLTGFGQNEAATAG
jgi:trigger factor